MKKTMFITSVIMVVVMAIALTTSSLAWFSASDGGSVGTNAVTISAKSSASQGLLIAHGDEKVFVTGTVDIDSGVTESYIPVVPYGASAADNADNVLYALQHNRFVGNNQKTEQNTALFANNYFQGYEYGTAPNTAAAYYKVEDLYVANSGNLPINVGASINIQTLDEDGAILYVAVLARHESATYAKINGDVNSDGVLTGYIDANGNATQDAGEVAYASVWTDADNDGVVDEGEITYYQDKDADGQIAGVELGADYLISGDALSQLVGETFGTEEGEDYAARDLTEINTLKWELLAFANSAESETLILGRYSNDAVYRTNAAGDKYVLSDASEVAIVVKGQYNDEETDEQFATRKAAQITLLSDPTRGGTSTGQPVLVRLDNAEQNNYFETNAVVADAYRAAGVAPSINEKTTFQLRGLKAGETMGDYMQVKVLAWYSNDLDNTKSGAYDEEDNPFGTTKKFAITFSIVEEEQQSSGD